MIFLTAWLGAEIPDNYRLLIYLVVIGAMLIYAVQSIISEKQRRSQIANSPTGPVVFGNVRQLTQIINRIEPAASVETKILLENQLDQYLSNIQARFGKIILRGIERGQRQVIELELDRVYVPLQAVYDKEIEAEFLQKEDPEAKYSRKDHPEQKREETIEVNDVFHLGKRIIITGGPGCGKTTVLQYIVWTLAKALLDNDPEFARQKLGLTGLLPLPIYVPLSPFAAYLRKLKPDAPPQDKTLAAFISTYLAQRQSLLESSPVFFINLLREGKSVVLLLDGLDEVPNETEREGVRQAIEDLANLSKEIFIIVTSRTIAYKGGAVLGYGFRQVRVLPLGEKNIQSLVHNAYAAIYDKAPKLAENQANELLGEIRVLEEERQRQMGEKAPKLVNSPLMVRMLLIVQQNLGKLPEQRAELYQKTIDSMLRPDYNLDVEVTEEIGRRVGESPATHRGMLRKLAFHMQEKGKDQGQEVDEDGLKRVFSGDAAYEPYTESLLALTRQRGALLEERDRQYRFLHLSFQEYLTAEYLAEVIHNPDQMWRYLEKGPVLDSWWHEPILLTAGYLDVNDPARGRKFLQHLAGIETATRRIEGLSAEIQLASAELAGQAYLESRFQLPDLQSAIRRRLESLVFNPDWYQVSLLLRREGAADVLDKLGWLPEGFCNFIKIPADPHASLKSNEFWIAKFPVTNLQYERFLQKENFKDRSLWQGWPRYDENSQLMPGQDWGDEPWNWLQARLQENDNPLDRDILYPRYWHDPRLGIARKCVPVVGITWYEAMAYCNWLEQNWNNLEEGQENSIPGALRVRLPTDVEWQTAAGRQAWVKAGKEDAWKNAYPWDVPSQATTKEDEIILRANVWESQIGRTTPVGMYPLGESYPYGLWDLAGNVWEWQVNFRDKDHDVLGLRGGSWGDLLEYARPSVRYYNLPHVDWGSLGFRVVVSPR